MATITLDLRDEVVKVIHADPRGTDKVRALVCLVLCQGKELDLLLDAANKAIDQMIALDERKSEP